jgi:tetratricopeptide (TPR) repeat protein
VTVDAAKGVSHDEKPSSHGKRESAVQAGFGMTERPTMQDRWLPLFVCVILVALIGGVFGGLAGNEFVAYDDDVHVTRNGRVRNGLTSNGLIWAFTTRHQGHWHPVTWLSHMLDCELFGLNPAGHHLSSLVLHGISTLLLFLLMHRMTRAPWRSALVAALFAIHPLHVEPVAWVADRKDLLSTLFLLLALRAWVPYAERGAATAYALSLASFTAGLLSKSMIVTLPALLFLLDAWPLNRIPWQSEKGSPNSPSYKRWILEKVPFFLLSAFFGWVAIWAMKAGKGGVHDLGIQEILPALDRAGSALIIAGTYLRRTVWPDDLAVMYGWIHNPDPWQILISGLVLLGISLAVIRLRRGYFTFGWVWFLLTLAPVAGLIQSGPSTPADRYTYLPLVGIFVMASWGASELALKKQSRGRAVIGVLAVMMIVALGLAARRQVTTWKDSESLFQRAIAVTPGSYRGHNNLGNVLAQQGCLKEAEGHFRQALRSRPGFSKAHHNLGLALFAQGDTEEAIRQFRIALRLDSDYVDALNSLGNAFASAGRLDEAEKQYRSALEIEPGFSEAFNNLGNVYVRKGRPGRAAVAYEQALALRPDYFEAHRNLARLRLSQERPREAIHHYEEALRLQPEAIELHYGLGESFVRAGDLQHAEEHFRAFLQGQPDHAGAHFHLGSLLALADRDKEALHHLKRSAELAPRHAPVRFALGLAYLTEGRLERAREEVQALITLDERLANRLTREIDRVASLPTRSGQPTAR